MTSGRARLPARPGARRDAEQPDRAAPLLPDDSVAAKQRAGSPLASEQRPLDATARTVFLARQRLFSDLPAPVLEVVASRFRPSRVERGAFVFLEGDRAAALSLLRAGRIKVIRETEAGREVIIRLIGPGEIFGAAGGWGEPVYPASAVAQEDSIIYRLPADEFVRLLRTEPDFALAVVRELGERLREAGERIRDLQTEQVEQRIARTLLRLARKSGVQTAGGVRLSLSRRDLAELSGTTLSTASRTVSAWARQGVVRPGRERITLLDPDSLSELAAEPRRASL